MLHPLNNTTYTVFVDLIVYSPSSSENKETTLLIYIPTPIKESYILLMFNKFLNKDLDFF